MLRKTLTILSLIGLLLSLGLWGASHLCPIAYYHESFLLSNCAGAYVIESCIECEGTIGFEWDDYHKPANFGYRSWSKPSFKNIAFEGEPPYYFIVLPHWIPVSTLGSLFVVFYLPIQRRRKRKKLGLCVKCGYDLRGSKERCPECGLSLEKRKTKGESTCEQEC